MRPPGHRPSPGPGPVSRSRSAPVQLSGRVLAAVEGLPQLLGVFQVHSGLARPFLTGRPVAPVAVVAAGHRGPVAAVAQGEQAGAEEQGSARGGGIGQAVSLTRSTVAEVSPGPAACSRARSRRSRRAAAAAMIPAPDSASSAGDSEAAGPADGEDGDESGEAHYGERRGHAGDVAAPGGQREVAAGHRGHALRPALPGGQQGHGRDQRAAQQGEGEAPAARPGGIGLRNGGAGAAVTYSTIA